MGVSVTPEGPQVRHLELDQSNANLAFSTWALVKGLITNKTTVTLPGTVYVPPEASGSYVSTRAAALHSHLLAQPHATYVFLTGAEAGGVSLHEVRPREASHAPDFLPVCDLPLANAAAAPAPAEPPLQATAVEVAQPSGAAPTRLLVSLGQGDLRLVTLTPPAGPAAAATSTPLHPLRPPPPLLGAPRPFQLLAACGGGEEADVLRCLVWAVRERAGERRASAEVYSLRLAVAGSGGGAELTLIDDAELLLTSRLPPHGAAVNAETGAVLLAVDSAGARDQSGSAPAAGAGLQASGAGVGACAAGEAAGAAGEGAEEGRESGSPRSLAEAVARLEAFTSQEPVGPLPQQRYHDIYAESGPDGVGAMGGEPGCTLHTFVPGEGGRLQLAGSLSCQPHRLLSAQPLPAGAARGGGAPGTGLLLGLTDDVDCALVAVAPAAAPGGDGHGFSIQHAASIPALAYVAAGKPQRRHLLLAPPGGDVACALVESARYSFLYRSTAAKQETGEQEVADLTPVGGVLGAALSGGPRGACRLVVLGRERLAVYAM